MQDPLLLLFNSDDYILSSDQWKCLVGEFDGKILSTYTFAAESGDMAISFTKAVDKEYFAEIISGYRKPSDSTA